MSNKNIAIFQTKEWKKCVVCGQEYLRKRPQKIMLCMDCQKALTSKTKWIMEKIKTL